MTTKCSFFFGGAHNPCCEQHDLDYSAELGIDRRIADRDLLLCAVAHNRPWRGIVMFIGVRLFGWIFYKGNK